MKEQNALDKLLKHVLGEKDEAPTEQLSERARKRLDTGIKKIIQRYVAEGRQETKRGS